MNLLDRTIASVLRDHPETLPVFTSHGLGLFAEEGGAGGYGELLRLRTALKTGGINPDLFGRLLEEKIAGRRAHTEPGRQGVNLFALLPCPLKVPVEEAFGAFLETLPEGRRREISFCLEGNANSQLSYYDYVENFEALDEIPDIVVAPGFNSFFHRRFVERFIRPGHFAVPERYAPGGPLAELGVADPEGHFALWAMNLLVFAVDHGRLGTRPVPRSLADLLSPELRWSVAIRGHGDGSFCETLLLTVYQEFGFPGVEELARNVRFGWHPSQMVKAAGSGREESPAVSILPQFFARHLQGRKGVSVVWPEDGALTSPVTLLVKAGKREELADVLDFLTGEQVARICAGAGFPTVHPGVDNALPPEAPYRWVGWGWIKGQDLKALVDELNARFLRAFREGG